MNAAIRSVPIWKRGFDIIVASVVLLLTLPLLFVVAICVRSSLGKPVFFRQQRPGLNGRPFTIFKFRTMRQCGDSSIACDAQRMSRLGAFLRGTSLDELPELWNVLRGEMSMVGPRPLLQGVLLWIVVAIASLLAIRAGYERLTSIQLMMNLQIEHRPTP